MPRFNKTFITPERYEEIQHKQISGPNGWLLFVACNSGIDLARNVKKEFERRLRINKSEIEDVPLLEKNEDYDTITKIFHDTETRPRLPEHVAGSNAFVFQYLSRFDNHSVVNNNLVELGMVIRALKVHGAKHITAVVPYLAYSRQDKPTFGKREATYAKWVADVLIVSGIDDILTYHLHNDSIKGFYEPHRVVALTGLDLFIEIFDKFKGMSDVTAASADAGGGKFTIYFAEKMDINYAITSKYRPKEQETDILGVVGEVKGKRIAIIADDETVTFNSLFNAIKELSQTYNIDENYVGISHNKVSKDAIPILLEAYEKYNLKELHVTDSVSQSKEVLDLPFLKVHSLADRFACTINRMHYNQSVSKIFYG